MGEDVDESEAEALVLGAGEASGVAGGADGGAEEALVGVDVADSVEEGLIEERGLDGGLAVAEERGEGGGGDGEGFAAGAGVFFGGCAVSCCFVSGCVDGEAAETAGVYEAEFLSGAEVEDEVGVGRDGSVWGGDEEAASHAEVDEELGGCLLA